MKNKISKKKLFEILILIIVLLIGFFVIRSCMLNNNHDMWKGVASPR